MFLKNRHWYWVGLSVAIFVATASAQPQVDSVSRPRQDSSKRNQKTNGAQNKQRGSDSLPISVKLLNTSDSERHAEQEAKRVEIEQGIARDTLRWTKGLGIFTLILAVGTLLLAAATIWMGLDARTHTRQGLRAYVFYSERFRPWAPTGLNIRFKNTGRTPAKNVEVDGFLSVAPENHTGTFPTSVRATESFIAAMAPQGELDVHFGPQRPTRTHFLNFMSVPELEQVRARASAIWVHGAVRYVDAFKKPRTTTFRYALIDDDLRNATEGNDWD